MWSAIEYVNSPLALAAFFVASLVAIMVLLLKQGPLPQIKDLPREHRHQAADKILEMHRESTRARHRLALMLLILLLMLGVSVMRAHLGVF